MKTTQHLLVLTALTAIALTIVPRTGKGQGVLAWNATKYFRYNIERVLVDKSTIPYTAKVIFSVSEPTGTQTSGVIQDSSGMKFWDILHAAPFTYLPSPSRLGIDVGWNTMDFVNTGASQPAPQGSGAGAALPIQINTLSGLSQAKACNLNGSDCPGVNPVGRFFVTSALPVQATGTGRVGLEGHPAWTIQVNGVSTLANVPVKSVVKDIAITDSSPVPRRQVVDINKCKLCHTGTLHGGTLIPRLSLHGGSRTEELGICVICHNSNQTDIEYRTSGNEESLDFKRMVHGIHAGGMRDNPLVIIGYKGSVNDFSSVRFPGELNNCMNCHIEINGKGTYELPLGTKNGSTITTASVYGGNVDVDPSNDLKITPTAAVCSACHDSTETRSHMQSGGASFSTLQSDINSGKVQERCILCHGPGRAEDVRRVHIDDN